MVFLLLQSSFNCLSRFSVRYFTSTSPYKSSNSLNMAKELNNRIFVVGVGMTKFEKPGSRQDFDYPDMVKEAVTAALKDAKMDYSEIQQATVGYIYGQSCSGQRALYEVGMTGIPIYNVNNACASGSTAIHLAKQFIETGKTDVVLACGFEKMRPGSLDGMNSFDDRANPAEKHVNVIAESYGIEPAPMTAQMFGNAGREHMEVYGTKPEHFAKIAWKNHKHSAENPRAQFRKVYSLDEIQSSKMIHSPLTKLQCSPTSDGSAAAILCSERYLQEHDWLKERAIEIVGQVMKTDFPSTFNEPSKLKNLKMIGYDVAKAAAKQLYHDTCLGPNDVDVIELHDCFSVNELITYEALGLCPEGKAGELIDRGDNTYGGKWVINPSGGLISKGHPIGATGVAQCFELSTQLRGESGKRQVTPCRLALQHNIGIGGAVVLTMYKRAYPTARAKALPYSTPGMVSTFFKSDRFINIRINQIANSTKTDVVIKMNVTNGPGGLNKYWIINFNFNPIYIECDITHGKVDTEITVTDDNLMKIFNGDLQFEDAFSKGQVEVSGNMTKGLLLRRVFNFNAKL